MSRAVLNVVTNALDAVENRPDAAVEIRVDLDSSRRKVRITVSDNGEGMSPETLARIFNLFVSTKGSRGTGLGLTVSRKILKEHHGEIHAESRLGEGSTFTLEFPLRQAGDAAPASAPPAEDDDDGGQATLDGSEQRGLGPTLLPGVRTPPSGRP